MHIDRDEAPLKEPFWQIESALDTEVVDTVLRLRFPVTYQVLEEALERADPLDVVYPGNPGEYRDVIREVLVLAAPMNAALDELPVDTVEGLLREGLARRFGEPPNDEKLRMAAVLVRVSLTGPAPDPKSGDEDP